MNRARLVRPTGAADCEVDGRRRLDCENAISGIKAASQLQSGNHRMDPEALIQEPPTAPPSLGGQVFEADRLTLASCNCDGQRTASCSGATASDTYPDQATLTRLYGGLLYKKFVNLICGRHKHPEVYF
jgi:hypothetical protein